MGPTLLDQPIEYTAQEGAQWHPWPEGFEATNPELIAWKPARTRFLRVRHRSKPGVVLMLHSMKWANGDRWDAWNGFTRGGGSR